jgi:hypothetical protein
MLFFLLYDNYTLVKEENVKQIKTSSFVSSPSATSYLRASEWGLLSSSLFSSPPPYTRQQVHLATAAREGGQGALDLDPRGPRCVSALSVSSWEKDGIEPYRFFESPFLL